MNDNSLEERPRRWAMPFFLLALAGFLASMVIHLSTFLGYQPTMDQYQYLGIGIFVVWVPAIIVMQKNTAGTSTKRFSMEDFPGWLTKLCGFFFAYALVNFGLFIYLMHGGRPNIDHGAYVLSSHGRLIQSLTEADYWKYKALEIRGFSGHWMLFYSVAAAALGVAALKKKKDTNDSGSLISNP